MISRIIYVSVYYREIVLLLTLLLAAVGWMSFQDLPIDAVPDITNVQVQVNTSVDGFVPEEIERTITFPIEVAMSGIAGVTELRSITHYGLSQVTVVFEEDTDILKARQWISERLQLMNGRFPKDVFPKLGPVSSGLGEIYHYSVETETQLTGNERMTQLIELRSLQDWYIKPRLLTVKGVAEINTIGGYEKQFHIQPRPNDLIRYGIHFADIQNAINLTNQNMGGGYVQQTGEQFLIQAVGLFKNMSDIGGVPVKNLETYKTVTIDDIARVTLARELRTGAALSGGQETVLGTVLMLLGENSRTVSTRVDERINEIQKGLPPGFKIKPLYNRSELVNATLETVEHNLLTGAFLVVIVLLFLLGNVRAALITALTIPLSLLITFIPMRYFGISGNLMSLGALDFGIIIDGAVIVLDNCVRVIQERKRQLKPGMIMRQSDLKSAVYDASVEIRQAAGFGELIIVVVFLPLFTLVGIEGKMFKPMAATFSIAVISALCLSFTTAPALASLLLTRNVADHEPWLMKQMRRLYSPILELGLKNRFAVLGGALVSLLIGIVLFFQLGGEFLPKLDERSYAIQFIRPINISLDQSLDLQAQSERIIQGFPEVARVFSRTGTSEVATDPMGVNLSDTYVMMKNQREWPLRDGGRRTSEQFVTALLNSLEEHLPGQRAILSQPIQMRFNELLEGTRADISVKVFGDDMEQLALYTKKIGEIIGQIRGAGDVEIELKGTSPILKITPKEGILKNLGVSRAEILETVSIALGGQEVGHFYEGVKRFPIIIRLSEDDRSDLNLLRSLPVGISSNSMIPLSEAANLHFEPGYSSISREQTKRRAAVMINPRGRDTESFVKEAKEIVEKTVQLPSGYFLEWAGNFKNLQEAKARLMIVTPVTFLLVLIMIYAVFKNIYKTLLIFSGVPLALIGGVLGLMLNQLPFSISAGVGFIALSGIAVLNGVVLVHYFSDLSKEGLRGEELARKGTSIRLRAVLMTALVDVFGFLPMMLSAGAGAEVQKPLASVVIGGIISSTLLTLVVLPSLYCLFEKQLMDIEDRRKLPIGRKV